MLACAIRPTLCPIDRPCLPRSESYSSNISLMQVYAPVLSHTYHLGTRARRWVQVDSIRMLVKSLDGHRVSESKEDMAVVEGLPTTSSCSVVRSLPAQSAQPK